MSDLIEEAAKAICTDVTGYVWDRLGDYDRDKCRNIVRAVFARLDALGYAVVPKEPPRDEEIARLKEALEDIASGKYSGVILTSFPPQDAAVNRARAALNGEKE